MEKDLKGKTVALGMSGGVDSSVAALLLKERGAEVIGLFMKNWEEDDEGSECPAARDYRDVVKVCQKLDIPWHGLEFVEEYREEVFRPFLASLDRGETPNPDILCNKEIKFKHFFQTSMEIGADFLATGHYCQNTFFQGRHYLTAGEDDNKDQTYFLYTIKENILQNVLFPVGHLKKPQVRELAHKHELPTAQKKDSTGICFIGKRKFKDFISRHASFAPGSFKNLDGRQVGRHNGVGFYTLGQRKGLGLGGPGEPWFVVSKEIATNTVYVERGEHPKLYRSRLTAGEFEWVSGSPPEGEQLLTAKIRYRQKNQECRLGPIQESGTATVQFSRPQRAITPGQSIVFYGPGPNEEKVCLGGGVILA